MTVNELLHKVRVRIFSKQLLNKAVLAIGSASISFVVVYWLGAFLPWYLILFVGLAVLFPVFSHLKDKFDLYKIAQRIDRENSLTDYLSTVYIFDKINAGIPNYEPRHSLTRDRAEKLAKQINLKTSYPVNVPKASIAGLILAVGLVVSIFFIHLQGLDWKFQTKAIPYTYSFIQKIEKKIEDKIREQEKQREDAKAKSAKDKAGIKKGDGKASESQPQNDVDASRQPNNTTKSGNGTENKSNTDDRRGDKNQQGQETAGNNSDQNGERGDKKGNRDDNSAGNKASDNQSNSLAQKAANAVGNALQKIKEMFQKGDAQSQSGEGKKSDQDSNQNQQGQSQQGNGKSQSQNSPGGQGQDASSGQSTGEKSDKTSEGQAVSKGGQSNDGEKKQGSGAGSDDGEKTLKEKQEQEAMGKLDQIYGKRSQNVKGEATVEAPQGNQKLKTDYSQNNAQHADKGGDITRDEVPQEMQEYVQNYMDQVHKHPYKKIKKH